MTNRRRDAEDVVAAALEQLRGREELSAKEVKRAQRRAAAEARSRRTLAGVGAGLLAGGLSAGVDLTMPAPVGIGFLVAIATIYLLREGPRLLAGLRRRPKLPAPAPAVLNPQGLTDGRAELIRRVLSGAEADLARLETAATRTADPEGALVLGRLAALGRRIVRGIAAKPQRFEAAQRLLTHHLDRAAFLGGLISAEPAPDRDKLADVLRVLGRMEMLFLQVETEIAGGDGRDLDLELKVIDQALDEDIRRR
jgi:hypothetical protein